jgi:GNAT superfamily N-acetyltransferase
MRHVFADASFARRIFNLDRMYWRNLAPAALASGVVDRDPAFEAGDSVAFFAGEGSPLTQANGELPPLDIEAISGFYRGRVAEWEAIVTPFAHPSALASLIERGARPLGWESVLYRPYASLLEAEAPPEKLRIVEALGDLLPVWSAIALRGFFGDDPGQNAVDLARIMEHAAGMRRYVAYWDGEPAAAATLNLIDGVAFLGGMATLPEFRGRGIQRALIQRRLVDGQPDADVATVGASAGSSSQRNAERRGFHLAWTQLSMRVPTTPPR